MIESSPSAHFSGEKPESKSLFAPSHHSNDSESEGCPPPTLRTFGDPLQVNVRRCAPRNVKRREVEARRFSVKEKIEEYLLQFELTKLNP